MKRETNFNRWKRRFMKLVTKKGWPQYNIDEIDWEFMQSVYLDMSADKAVFLVERSSGDWGTIKDNYDHSQVDEELKELGKFFEDLGKKNAPVV